MLKTVMTPTLWTKIGVATALTLSSWMVLADSPAGLWRTIDDDGKTEKSNVRLTETNGTITGKVEKIADPTKAKAVCDECTDDRKGKPIIGMTIMKNYKKTDDANIWDSGEILDPNNGKTYKSRLRLLEGGKKLEVRGYAGIFYRNQIWQRID